MRGALLLLSLALVLPADALAAGVSLESGPVGELAGTVKGLATGFFFVSLVLGLLIEGLGTAPGQQRDFAGVVWRAVWILVLLTFYGQIFGSVIKTADGIAANLMPSDAYAKFVVQMMDVMGFGETKEAASSGWGFSEIGGVLFSALTNLLILLSMLAHWVLSQLGRILVAVFYILGPLALVFSIPRGSGAAGKWFAAFVSYAIWPILSALILRLLIAVAFDALPQVPGGSDVFTADTLGALAVALVLGVTALSVPSLASSLVGSAAQNFASAGLGQAVGLAAKAGALAMGPAALAGTAAKLGVAGLAHGTAGAAKGAAAGLQASAALAGPMADGLRRGADVAGAAIRQGAQMHGFHFGAEPPSHLDGPSFSESPRATPPARLGDYVAKGAALEEPVAVAQGPAVARATPAREASLGDYVAGTQRPPPKAGSFGLEDPRPSQGTRPAPKKP